LKQRRASTPNDDQVYLFDFGPVDELLPRMANDNISGDLNSM
jgi:hypothetical protein